MVDEKIIEAFYMMWDSFPGNARLIHKNRTVLAANKIARKSGFEIGTLCSKVGAPELHKDCKANKVLSTKNGQAVKSAEGKIRYWLPVKDCDDVYVHITLDPNTIK
ncbi:MULTISPECIES: hypothetical protein [unclassified Clostridium]|uniref:hypothetical protein n=1 Tax=unclassified Clostridium TaxID=2614128 RepID=UPI0002974A47|nr:MULTISPECIES: hypothetical protein [unclassified Clostridium]EKQ54387.1 MAG: hypothetical protein A370_03210 [Clostridium sp. Maddingley MBC34-26]